MVNNPASSAEATHTLTDRSQQASPTAPPSATHSSGRTSKRAMTPGQRRKTRRHTLLFFALVAPNAIVILVFSYYAAAYNIVLSFMDWDMVAPMPEWVGLQNFLRLVTDMEFWHIMLNTLIFTGVSVAGSLIGGLALGGLLATRVPFTGLTRTFAFTPHMIPGAAVGMLWLFMFDPNYGLSRWAFSLVGLDSPNWTTTSDWSIWAITIAYLWQRLGFVAIIYYTAILDLPSDVHEAASLDGATAFQRLRHVSLPLLSPITFFLSITGVLSAAQAFDLISIMTGGGPGISSSTLSWMIYDEAFQNFDVGRASAAATILLVLLLTLTFIQVRYGEKKVNYAS